MNWSNCYCLLLPLMVVVLLWRKPRMSRYQALRYIAQMDREMTQGNTPEDEREYQRLLKETEAAAEFWNGR